MMCCLCCPLHFGNIWPLIFLAWVVSSLRFVCHLVMAWFNMLLCHFTEFWMIILSLHFWVYSMVSFIDVALYEFLAWLFCCISMTSLKLPIKDRNLQDFSCMSPNHNYGINTTLCHMHNHKFMAWTQLFVSTVICFVPFLSQNNFFLCHCKK